MHIMNCPVATQNDGDEMIQQRRNQHLENPVNYKRTISKIPSRNNGMSFYSIIKASCQLRHTGAVCFDFYIRLKPETSADGNF